MKKKLAVAALLTAIAAQAAAVEKTAQPSSSPDPRSHAVSTPDRVQPPYQHQDTWYEFMLKQFNAQNKNYGNWIEERRHDFIEGRIKNPYFAYSVCMSLGVLVATAICVKLRIDHRRAMWITAEMMTDVYNQDAYSRQIAQEAIDRYNKHIERCNRAIEAGQNGATLSPNDNQMEQLRTELMRVAEERDNAVRERDMAREDLRKKQEILAGLSLRLEAQTAKSGALSPGKSSADLRGADAKLIAHINTLQEQLYVERNLNRKARGA